MPADSADRIGDSESETGFFTRTARLMKYIAIGFGTLAIAYFVYAFFVFSQFYGRDIHYPQTVLAGFSLPGGTGGAVGADGDDTQETCSPSRTVAMQIWLIDHMVNENVWVPARPFYKLGFFGLMEFEDTPFFDNKASEQLGMLDVARRLGIELTDSLGRTRGTSAEDKDLVAAQSALRVNDQAWYLNNPFNARTNTVSVSASASYRQAIELYERYNDGLARCERLFDVRADNLREALGRFTATLGATTAQLGSRSRAVVYDASSDVFVPGEGNNLGWFDFQGDNHFHRARGKMFALHGILQGMREDFYPVVKDRNLDSIWDRMEQYVAEAARMDPWIVSNGAPDSTIQPAHLNMMTEKILRARTSMVEIRDILQN